MSQLIKENPAMSTKFEQLLDYIVNEEMDKANELFHEIVVEKSRNIYENLIAQEAEEEDEGAVEESDEEDESAVEEADEEDESAVEESEEEASEGMEELEDSYMMDGDDEMDMEPSGLEKTDDLGGDVMVGDEEDEMGGEEEQVAYDIQDAIQKLEDALAQLGGEAPEDEFDAGDDMGDDMGDDEEETPEMMGVPTMEGKKRMTREYVEKVGNDWEKNSMKGQKQHVAAGTGDTEGAPQEGKSPIASGANKPGPAGVNAKNLNQGATEGQSNTGTSPGKVSKGLAPHSGEKMAAGMHNVDGKKSGVKTLSSVKGGHGAEKKGSGPGPVGSGTGDKAGQTSTPAVKQFLKPYSK